MHSEQRSGRFHAATILTALALAAGVTGCSESADARGNVAPAPVDRSAQTQEPAGVTAARSTASLPGELVGSWSADDPQGVGSWTIAFAADGRYEQSNPRRAITVGGQAAVAGRKLYLQPEDADSQTFVWQVTGERLRLDDHVYRRTAGDAGPLLGSWAGATATGQTLTFNPDWTYDVADASGGVSHSTYSVAGDRLSAGRSTYTWTVDAGQRLQLRLPDGRVLSYSRTT
ncbi:MAG: hypothetical protein QOK35_2909 [Pseudonocardiales bacterium]|nr:hypothetical protein [Pseudonocardiales bacterium]